jgi:ribosome biogenesis GTPase / thiamine phosphate phosphatase
MKGRVIKSTGSFYQVIGTDEKQYNCRPRGKLRLEGYKESNPVAVGDWVEFDAEGMEGNISEILPRTNHVLRQSVKRTEHSSVLAANVDQSMLMVTLAQPKTSLGFIDRFLVACEAFRIPQIILFNKVDLLSDEQMELTQRVADIYSTIGVKTLMISALNFSQKNTVMDLLEGKTTLLAGHSGTGKSTMLNQLSPYINQTVGDISSFSDKGMHTTTFAEMFQLNANTYIIDTPGIKEWGLVDMNEQELSDYFPEMRDLRLNCKFGSKCIHFNEPKCAIIDAVKAGTIALSRYENYLGMVTGKDNRK